MNDSRKKVIVKDLEFYNCEFNEISFKGLIFNKRILRYPNDNSKFIKKLKLVSCELKEKLLINNIETVCEFDFYDTLFEKKIEIKGFKYINKLNFKNATFRKTTDLHGSIIIESNFYKTNFEDVIVFENTIFEEDVKYTFTTFKKIGMFKRAIYKKNLDLEDSIILGDMNFLQMSSIENKEKNIDVLNRETARIIKNNFEKDNNIIEANRYYAVEMQKREYELGNKSNVNEFEWLVFKIHGITSNYSQSWLLSLFWIIIIGCLYSYFFTFSDSQLDYECIVTERLFNSFIYQIYLNPDSMHFFNLMVLMSSPYIIAWSISIKNFYFLIFIVTISSYIYVTDDFTLSLVSNNINPFSIITEKGTLSLDELIYRVTTAYLLYQFVISIRQNTRRK